MKQFILALGLATAAYGQHLPLPQEVAERLVAREKKESSQFFVGKGIERAFEDGEKFLRVRLGIEPGPRQSGYNVLEVLCSNKPLSRWPKTAEDVAGKTIDYYADYQLDNHQLETASTIENGKGKYHFYLLGDKPKKTTEKEYNTHWGKYYSILQKIVKKLSD